VANGGNDAETMSAPTRPDAAPGPGEDLARRRERRSWYWFDWANSAYVTTVQTVLLGPYLTSVAKQAACPGIDTEATCHTDLHVLGLPVSPGSLVFYVVTISTICSALVLPVVGALADRVYHRKALMCGFAWAGSLSAAAMYLIVGHDWQLGVVLTIIGNIALGSALVVYYSFLVQIATPDERDRVSSVGWSFGYLGGFILLALNLVIVQGHKSFGLSTGQAVRFSLLSAGVWWAAFTLIPFLGLRDRQPLAGAGDPADQSNLLLASFSQLANTLRHLRGYPQTLMFLAAYLFFNDGIQTVISASSVYGSEQLGLSSSQLIITILLVQFVAFGGALLFGRLAGSYGAWRVILTSLFVWTGVVTIGFFLPAHQFGLWLGLATLIGIVLGGSQALSRSLYSQLIPAGREAEYFSLYQACERGTSWFGTLLFGVVQQVTDSYRWAIIALVVFFVLGGTLLSKVDVRQGILDAGNPVPAVI
jgi:UMF1 family MFS transporter